jgi:hypothetical protein
MPTLRCALTRLALLPRPACAGAPSRSVARRCAPPCVAAWRPGAGATPSQAPDADAAPLWSPRGAAGRVAALAAAAALSLASLPPPAALALVSAPPAPPSAPSPSVPARPRPPLARPPPPPLTAEERATTKLFRAATPSVVFITTLAERRDAFTLDPVELPAGAGSGFFWDAQGHLVTNYHVVKDAAQLRVTLADTSVALATVVGFDEDRDVAVLQVPPDVAAKVNPLPIGSSSDLLVGQRVYAIGARRSAARQPRHRAAPLRLTLPASPLRKVTPSGWTTR